MDRECWDREVTARYAQVLRGLMAVAGRREPAEDALHDALVASLVPGVIERIERADAWLYAVAVRKLRRSSWRRRLEVLLDADLRAYPAPSLQRVEALEVLEAMTPRQRELVIARYFLDLSFAEIAEHFDISVGAATSTVSQALARVRKQSMAGER